MASERFMDRNRPSTRRWMAAGTKIAAVVALAGFHAPALNAQAACEDVAGAWTIDLTLPGAPATTVTLTLEQSECEVTGLVTGQNETPISDGKVEGWTVTFGTAVTNQADGSSISIVWEGTVDGDAIGGTLSAPGLGEVPFTGKRAEGG